MFGWIDGSLIWRGDVPIWPLDWWLTQIFLVTSLINSHTRSWLEDEVKSRVVERDKEAVLDVSLGDPEQNDRLIWPHERRGGFTVKSGYHRVFNLNR